ncbi:MAG TPA: type IV pilus biogenesis/stability protein PilW [Steroidobacteraceae bacterium]|jgi:type IV pilus assembly protein PilF
MSSSVVKILAVALGVCAAACSHNSQFKKASPAVMAATNMQLAIEYLKLGKLASSQEFMERALSEDPGNPDVQMTAGLVYERVNDIPKAERAYSTGYRLGKKDPNIQNSYAGFLCRTGKAVAGEKLFAAVASNPLYQTPEVALINAGVCVRGTGDLVDAERYFTRALAIHPNLPEALLQLGNIAFDRGDAAQAREIVKRYLAVNPPTSEVLWLGVRAERKLGDATTAASYARRVQTEFPDSEQAQMMRSGVER